MGHGVAVSSRDKLCQPVLVPPERGHLKNSVLLFPDSSDYLWDQGDRGKSIKEELGQSGANASCPLKNYFGNERCLLRRRGRHLACRRLPIFPKQFVGGTSTRLRGLKACLLPGSVCPAHALLSASSARIKKCLEERLPWRFI